MSLTSTELSLMSKRGHDGCFIARVSGRLVVGKVATGLLPYEGEYAQLASIDGRSFRVRRLELSSATKAEVEAAYAREIETRASRNLAENPEAPKLPPVTPFRRTVPKAGALRKS